MKPTYEFAKVNRKDLQPTPEWLRQARERVQNSSFAQLSDEEIGQLCEALAEKAARERKARQPT